MNERIEDLYKQAQKSVIFLSNSKESKEKIVIEKFAELIIGKCIEINQVETTASNLPEYNLGMLEGYRRARENMSIHFGVEE